MTSPLLAPLPFANGAVAKNRVWLAPMTNSQSHDDGSLGDDELRWLERRADGGFGVLETCAAHVDVDGKAWEGELGVFDDRLVPGLSRLAKAIGARGALTLAQLFHGGLRADPKLTGGATWSASEHEEPGLAKPRAATDADLARVLERFRDAAARCERAGLDGVELHGAHGYLLGQFLSSTMNRRDDRWGGSFANRARLLREATRAVRGAVAERFVVGVRISPEDWGQAKGLDLDESLELARGLADDGIDFLHISLWNAAKNTKKRPDAHPVTLFRAALPARVKLVVAGSLWTREDAEKQLALGADAVALGRAAILNPEWPKRIEDVAWEPKRPPATIAELVERGLSAKFAGYMRQWKSFVAD